jgi:hypothetical protein
MVVSGRLNASAALLLGKGTTVPNRNTMGEPSLPESNLHVAFSC